MDIVRKLASIQKIITLEPIPGADKIERAQVLGWQCVVKKGEFQVGDFCIYFELDSLIPKSIWSGFLFKEGSTAEKYRLKTVKMKGQISQGLAMPTSILLPLREKACGDPKLFLGDALCISEEGYDVTELIGVEKYEPYIPAQLQGLVKGSFPCFIPKTDEPRLQAFPRVLQMMMNRKIYVTEKIDGTSFTCFIHNDEFGVCSRNMELKESEGNLYWKIARQLDLENKLRHFRQSTMGHEIAIQGEVYGQGIQGNKYHLEDVRLAVFNVYDISEGKYLNFTQFKACCDALDLTTVPILNEWSEIKNDDVDSWIQKAFGESVLYPQTPREGIVVRGLDEETIDRYGRFSFKVINNEFLLKYGE